jgi:hypothetical protein
LDAHEALALNLDLRAGEDAQKLIAAKAND